MKKKIKTPVLLDTNILINFKGQLGFLFNLFESILIHKQIIEEVLDESIKDELDLLMNQNVTITIVDDKIIEDSIEQSLFEKCDQELRDSFNIKDSKDLGEYKTLLYAKFNNVKLLSSQDTTVWTFVTESLNFNDIDCITIQDLSYLIYVNADNKKDRKLGKKLYKHFGRNEHTFEDFERYMVRNNNEIPKYIEFENNRIDNYSELVHGYIKSFYSGDFYNTEELERDLVHLARRNSGTCIDCLYSRINLSKIDLLERNCSLKYEPLNDKCALVRESFSEQIRYRK